MSLVPALVLSVFAATGAQTPYQYSFTLWNWERGYTDFEFFQHQVDACKQHGFTLIELGAGWADCERPDDAYDFSMVDERIAYVKGAGLDLRLRVNVAHWPKHYDGLELYHRPDGAVWEGKIPSLSNAQVRTAQLRFVGALAEHLAGRGYTYTPGFSVHMEVKFADWNNYEPSARKAFQDWLAGRYGSVDALNAAWGAEYSHFGGVDPPLPSPTQGEPALTHAEADWIRFREWVLADWVTAFAATVRAADPSARISVPLGESFRRESAAFANLDYWGYSRSADEVVHSYDFFWHGPQGLDNVPVAVATMTGITQRPVVFEIDGAYVIEKYGYTAADFQRAGELALEAGAAGVQVTNWGSTDIADQPWLSALGGRVRALREKGPWAEPPAPRVLYYVSKWQNYAFREGDEWVHERQFALWRRLVEAGIPTRIVTDENLLHEDLRAPAMAVPFATAIDAPVRDRLRAMAVGMHVVADTPPGTRTPVESGSQNFGVHIAMTGTPFAEDERPVHEILELDKPRRVLRIAAAQFATEYDVQANVKRMKELIEQAAAEKVRVIVFSELALTGYTKAASFRDTLDWNAVEAGVAELRAAAIAHEMYVIFGAPTRDGEDYFCSAVAIGPDGAVLDVFEKIYLAGEAWAASGRHLTTFDIDGVSSGTFICHDERYAPLVQLRALKGAQLFFYISCESGMDAEHKIDPYRAQIQARAQENGVYIVHANAPADLANLTKDGTSHGQSRIIAPDGHVLKEASVDGDELVIADINMDWASDRGMGKALDEGPLKAWMRAGIELVEEPRDDLDVN